MFALNTAIASGGQLVTYIGDSDYQYGVAEGEMAAKAINGQGNVAILLGILGDSPEVQRLAGIKSALAKYPGIKIVTTEVDLWQNAKNLADTQDLLSKYPKGQLAAVIAQGPEMYLGASYAAKIGRTDVKFIAGDYSTQVEAGIKAGQLYGTVDQSPALEGQLGAQLAYDWLTGKKSRRQDAELLHPAAGDDRGQRRPVPRGVERLTEASVGGAIARGGGSPGRTGNAG